MVFRGALSSTGRFVAFTSSATDLVVGDTNRGFGGIGGLDVFRRDRIRKTTIRVNVATNGTEADADTERFAMSGNGRYIAFITDASTLTPGEPTRRYRVFLRDVVARTTEEISTRARGEATLGLAMSANGRFVGFSTYVASSGDSVPFYMYDRRRDALKLIARNATSPSISGDGRFVAFAVARRGGSAIMLLDRRAGTKTRVDVGSAHRPANGESVDPSISANGRFVAFASLANNLVARDTNDGGDVFLRDTRLGKTVRVSVRSDGSPVNRCPYTENDEGEQFSDYCARWPVVSRTGRFVAFEGVGELGPESPLYGVFLRDTKTKTTKRSSVANTGQGIYALAPALSADGRYAGFAADALGFFVRGPLR